MTISDKELEDIGYIENPQEIIVENIFSVSQALRKKPGEFLVRGTITSTRPLNKMISSYETRCIQCSTTVKIDLPKPVSSVKPGRCSQCSENTTIIQNKEYVSVITVDLQDSDKFNDLEKLQVNLFDKDTENIRVGEAVAIDGKMYIDESKGKKLFPCFYAKSLKYDENTELVLTPQDINGIKKFVQYCNKNGLNILDKLVKMYDNQIIGCELPKKGFLLSAINSIADENRNYLENSRRNRIHSLLVGPPGTAKTSMLKAIVRLVPNSRYESAGGNASGRSLTAIVTKEDENHILRVGPVPLARNHLCGLNELGRMDFEDQKYLLDLMEEGWFTITKYGISAKIYSPTTIIASANPLGNSDWNDDSKIDLDEIPALKPIKDRFDLIFIFKRQKDDKEIRKYAYQKGKLDESIIPDYSKFIIKYLEYAKRLNPKIDDDAKTMLNEFYVNVQGRGWGSNRVLDSLYRLAEAVARLKLKHIVDAEDAQDVQEFYNEMLKNFEMNVSISTNPKKLTYDKFVEILQDSKNTETLMHVGMTVKELHRIACKEDDQIMSYLGSNGSIENNKKLKNIITMLRNNSNVKHVGINPICLKWSDGLPDLSDLSDQAKTDSKNKNSEEFQENEIIRNENTRSGRSGRSDSNIDPDKEVKCPDCDERNTPYYMKFHRQNTGHRDWRENV